MESVTQRSKDDQKYIKNGVLQLDVFKHYLETNMYWHIGNYAIEGDHPDTITAKRCTFVFDT